MTIQEIVQSKLEKHPEFRERKNRAKYLAILVLRDMGIEEKQKQSPLSLEEMAEFGIKYGSYERAWRDILLNNESLQGQDYNNDGSKEKLEQEKQLALGYRIGFKQDVAKLKTLN